MTATPRPQPDTLTERTTKNERLIATVWDHLCREKAPTKVKSAFQKLALPILDNIDNHNLKFWIPQIPDEDWEER